MPQAEPDQKQHPAEQRSAEKTPLGCARWMTSRLHTVKPRDSVSRARTLMEEHRINQLPVIKDGLLVGIVTDRDLRDAVSAITTSARQAGIVEPVPQTADEIAVETVMTHNVITLTPHSNIITAAELMRRQRIGSVPIVDGQSLAGIVTRSDILEAFVGRENGKTGRADRQQNGETRRCVQSTN
jgi:acetoin utilization protein AcuB